MMDRSQELERLRTWTERLRTENASLAGVLDAFAPLFAELLKTRAALLAAGLSPVDPDPQRLARRLPRFVDAPLGEYAQAFLASARRILPVMARSFPGISEDLRKLMYALESDAVDSAALMEGVVRGDEAALARQAKSLGVDARSLELAAGLALRPVLEAVGSEVARAATLGAWGQGYCPVCGALPALAILRSSGQDDAYLKNHGGQRWLHCSRCAAQWRFQRHACPHCGNEEHGTLEYRHPEGRAEARADLCRKCNRYLATCDASGALDEPVADVAALGLLPMDVVMQRDGFAPVARTAWNSLDP
ncbi:formate dehydrogenase accessory protein FdhE [Desulfocurvus sp.]|uniref:formate dehydrogenase accessory protein FdhE n=1 Tax=Desulfocurvus sp. TaxID=2871698 RepID=UPI0025BE7415|nr:formate dehydrogenase accessory protein FdhE [Desulfocurvus sp.]MCK9238768.1 formate dehydrogenase accessory protein FdhE [Desulfocurvus sp.]